MIELAFATVIFAGLIEQPPTVADDVFRVTNVTLRLMRSRHGSQVTLVNPNSFAVFDVVATCDFKRRRSQVISSAMITITDAVQANGTRTLRDLGDVDWPAEARTANCISTEAKRLPD
jgi:hypothetical protein